MAAAEHIRPKTALIHWWGTPSSSFIDLLSVWLKSIWMVQKQKLNTFFFNATSFTQAHFHRPAPTPVFHINTHSLTLTHPLVPRAETLTQVGLSVSLWLHRTWVQCLWWGALRSSLSTLILARWRKTCHRTFNQQTSKQTHSGRRARTPHTITHTHGFIMLAILQCGNPSVFLEGMQKHENLCY